ncbi:MAG: prepilin-type N-terminal cleavage/methylation domain-containing protein [Prochlorococcus sp.]
MVNLKDKKLGSIPDQALWNQILRSFVGNRIVISKLRLINQVAHSQSKNVSDLHRKKKSVVSADKRKVYELRNDSNRTASQRHASGFTMVEVLIAGVLLAMVMAGVSRLSLSSLVSSKNQLERTRIEAAINDNIQLLQRADSLITFESIPRIDEQKLACSNPAKYLKTQILESSGRQYVQAPNLRNASNKSVIDRSVNITSAKEIAIVIYSFEGPGATKIASKDSSKLLHENEMKNATEQRILELNPNFQARCYK